MRASRTAVLGLVLVASCLTPATDHLDLDRKLGKAEVEGAEVREVDGLAAIRELSPGRLRLRAASPVLNLEMELAPGSPAAWEIIVENAMPAAELTVTCPGSCSAAPRPTERPTRAAWDLTLEPGATAELRIAPPDWDEPAPFRFAAMSDVQEAIPEVDEIVARMNEDDSIRFVISTGDLTHRGRRDELEDFLAQLEALDVPFFTTYGNHEFVGDPLDWHELFGPFNSHFRFKGVTFSLVDSSAASIDPDVYARLETWLDASRDEPHLFTTHVPPFEPVGTRSVSFRSRTEAAKLVAMLADGDVDLAIFGHIHTLHTFSTGGIPAYISGGGGAIENRLDGIGRHYLTVDADPAAVAFSQVGVVRIEDD